MDLALPTTVAPAMRDWALQCPDAGQFAALLAARLVDASKMDCTQCGEESTIGDMRPDESYWCSGELICRSCWEAYSSGSMGNPDFRPPPWPETRDMTRCRPRLDGLLRDPEGKVVGIVKDYNPQRHYGHVERFGYPAYDAEYGSLDPDYDRVTDLEPRTEDLDARQPTYAAVVKDVMAQVQRVFNLPQ
jgi:hypothetical protein